MRIIKLDIKGFGKIENSTFSPGSGFNIFYGPNEAGKSTLQAFIKAMLFGLKSGRRGIEGTVNQNRRFRPWSGKAFAGLLEYELDSGRCFCVGRNFDNNTLTVYDEYSNDIISEFAADKETIAKFAEQHLGISENVFERTAFIGQMQSVINQEGRKILASRLLNLKQSGDEGVSFQTAVNALRQAQITFVGSGRTTIRPINLLTVQLQEALQKEKTAIELHEAGIEIFKELEQTKKEAEKLRVSLEELNNIRRSLYQNSEIKMLCDKRRKLCEFLKQADEIGINKSKAQERKEHLAKESEELMSFAEFTRTDADCMVEDNIRYKMFMQDMRNLLQKININDEKIIETESDLAQYSIFKREGHRIQEVLEELLRLENEGLQTKDEDREHRLLKQKKISFTCILLSTVLLPTLYFFRKDFSPLLLQVLVVCGVTFFLMWAQIFIRALVKQKKEKTAGKEDKDATKKLQDYRQLMEKWMLDADVSCTHDLMRLKSMYDDKQNLLKELYEKKDVYIKGKTDLETLSEVVKNDILTRLRKANICENQDKFCADDITSWKKGLEEYISISPLIKALENEISSFIQESESIYRQACLVYGEDIKSRTQLEKAIEKLNEQMRGKKPMIEEEKMSIPLVEELIESTQDKINQELLSVNTLTTRLENIPDEEVLQRAYEKVQALNEEKENMVFLSKAIETAISVLTEASVEIQRDYVPHLSRELNRYLTAITGGLYDNAKADDNLALNILPKEHIERILPEQLSSGTIDQVYLSLRFAAVRMIEKEGESIPLFFDEPFSQYDEERTKNALRLLVEESNHRQIFLYTCKMREVELAGEIGGNGMVNIIEL